MSEQKDKIRVSILRNPFKMEREDIFVDRKSIKELIEDAGFNLEEIDVLAVDKDKKIISDNWDSVPESDHMILRAIPKDGGGTDLAMIIGGAALIAGGIALTVLTGGIGTAFGIAMIGAGVGMMVGGAVLMAMPDMPVINTDRKQEVLPSIRGSRNTPRQGATLPILFGRHLVVPDVAALPYTRVIGDNQYLNQLFCPGYKNINIDESTIKIGDTNITNYTDIYYDIQKGDIADNAYYAARCIETSVQQTVYSSSPIVRTTANNCRQINVIVNFPQGLCKYNDDGDRKSHSISVTIRFRKVGEDDLSWINIFSGSITSSSNKSVRREYSYLLDNLTPSGSDYLSTRAYEVQVSRSTNSNDIKLVEDFSWDSLKAYTGTFDEIGGFNYKPIYDDTKQEITVFGLEIKATDQLSGTVDQLNFEAQGTYRDWNGLGSGTAYWIADQETSNPAAMFLYVLQDSNICKEPVDDSMVDWQSLEDWWTFCDTNGFECNGHSNGETTTEEYLTWITTSSRASWSMIDGKYTIIIDTVRPNVVQYFTPRNSFGFSGSRAFSKKPTTANVQFVDASVGYEVVERQVAYNQDTGLIEYDTEILDGEVQEVSTYGVTDGEHAAKIGAYSLACAWLRQEIYTFSVDVEYLICTRGDRVQVSHDVPLLGLGNGRTIAVFESGGNTDGIRTDEYFKYEVGETYGLTLRMEDGSSYTRELENPATVTTVETQDHIFSSPMTGTGVLYRDLLVMFGYSGQETRDVIITEIKPGEDLTANLVCVDYAPAIFQADQGSIPVWDPGISTYNDSGIGTTEMVNDIPDVQSTVRDAWNRAAEGAASALSTDYYATAPGAPLPTNTPAIPTLSGEGIFRGFIIRWDQQVNLRNPYQLELQVSADETTWYSLGFGVSNSDDWHGVAGETTDIPEKMISYVHSPTPFVILQDGNGDDYPTGRTLYYRIRRRTLADDVTDYSASISLTSSVIEDGNLGYDSINANNIKAGAITADVIEAGFIETTSSITIGYVSDTGGTLDSPNDGDRRVYIDGDEIIFTKYKNGVWATDNVAKIGGSLDGDFLAALQARYVMVPGALDNDRILHSGEAIPSDLGYLLDFESDYLSIINGDSFFTNIEGVSRNYNEGKWGYYGVQGSSGVTRELASRDNQKLTMHGDGWFFDFFMKRTHYLGDAYDFFTISCGSDYIKLYVNGSFTMIEMQIDSVTTTWSYSTVVTEPLVENRWDHWFLGWDGSSNNLDIYFNGVQIAFPFGGELPTWDFIDIVFNFSDPTYNFTIDDLYMDDSRAFAGIPGDHYSSDMKWSQLFDVNKDLVMLGKDNGVIAAEDPVVSIDGLGSPVLSSVKGVIEDVYETEPGVSWSFSDYWYFCNFVDADLREKESSYNLFGFATNTIGTVDFAGVPASVFQDFGAHLLNEIHSSTKKRAPFAEKYNVNEGSTSVPGIPNGEMQCADGAHSFNIYYDGTPQYESYTPWYFLAVSDTISFYTDPSSAVLYSMDVFCYFYFAAGNKIELRFWTRSNNVDQIDETEEVVGAVLQKGWNNIQVHTHMSWEFNNEIDGTQDPTNPNTKYVGVEVVINGIIYRKVRAMAGNWGTYAIAPYCSGVSYCVSNFTGCLNIDIKPSHMGPMLIGMNKGKIWEGGYTYAELLAGDVFPSDEETARLAKESLIRYRDPDRDLLITPHSKGKILMDGVIANGSSKGKKGDDGPEGPEGPEGPSFIDGGTWDTVYAVSDDIDGGGW